MLRACLQRQCVSSSLKPPFDTRPASDGLALQCSAIVDDQQQLSLQALVRPPSFLPMHLSPSHSLNSSLLETVLLTTSFASRCVASFVGRDPFLPTTFILANRWWIRTCWIQHYSSHSTHFDCLFRFVPTGPLSTYSQRFDPNRYILDMQAFS